MSHSIRCFVPTALLGVSHSVLGEALDAYYSTRFFDPRDFADGYESSSMISVKCWKDIRSYRSQRIQSEGREDEDRTWQLAVMASR